MESLSLREYLLLPPTQNLELLRKGHLVHFLSRRVGNHAPYPFHFRLKVQGQVERLVLKPPQKILLPSPPIRCNHAFHPMFSLLKKPSLQTTQPIFRVSFRDWLDRKRVEQPVVELPLRTVSPKTALALDWINPIETLRRLKTPSRLVPTTWSALPSSR